MEEQIAVWRRRRLLCLPTFTFCFASWIDLHTYKCEYWQWKHKCHAGKRGSIGQCAIATVCSSLVVLLISLLCEVPDFTHWLIYYNRNWRTNYYIACITLLQSYVTLYRTGWRAELGKDIIMSMWLYFTGSPKMNQCPLAGFVWTQTEKMIPAFKCNLASRVFLPELSLEQQW